ncbi:MULTISPECIES: carboxyl transferase domain-containing protein [Actinomyces]|uniref:acetyl-CoA carboxylase n=1 Tax=Actinomyces respiraculi TaxID=2744574 RepID=A0A7T0LLF5_9ACTO|nr:MULTISPECIES: carboxyl transferase domain-containing protein [Actinomyces]QPL05792.1 NUDIX domain-containing protein [Actinomyces respiraculi]
MRRLLVAARSGTALRLARSARALGLTPVGVFTAVDRDNLWLQALDDAVEIGAYDDVDALVAAALDLKADALHPGVGFAAESAALARAVGAAGLTWVGPSAEALDLLTDKLALAGLARRLGVPAPLSLPVGTVGTEDLDEVLALVPGPAVVKTVHGGGGRGVVVLPGAQDPARGQRARHALASLADLGPLMLQEAVGGARHVEVQALADASGHLVTLGTRECSVQRRSQKVLEEAPAPFLTKGVVSALEEYTRALLGAAGLTGAATCEFLVPADGEPLLLEVNARLQVEHAVTEEVTGADLVRAQLLLAQGADLEHALDGLEHDGGRVPVRGHAVEARLYAEDPDTLLPESGDVLGLAVPLSLKAERSRAAAGLPAGLPRLRTERSVFAGDALVPGVSDPLALLVAVGQDRQEALDALDEALAEVSVRGVRTLGPLLREALAHPDLRAEDGCEAGWTGEDEDEAGLTVTTRWLEEVLRPGVGSPAETTTAPTDPTPGVGSPAETTTAPTDPTPGVGSPADATNPDGALVLRAPMAGTVVAVEQGRMSEGRPVVVLEAMKMRVPVPAPIEGDVSPEPGAVVGTTVRAGERLALLTPTVRTAGPAAPPPTAAPRDATSRVTALADPGSLSDVVNDDAVLTARLRLDGREAVVWAQDPTVRGGTIGLAGARRVAALIDRAADQVLPVICLLDGGGARVQEGVDALGGVGLILAAQTRAHARTVQVGLVLGPAAGGAAYAPALTDVLVMVEGRGQVFLTGPAVLTSSTGERVDAEALGGARVHAERAGTAHLTVPDEAGAWRAVRRLLAYAPTGTREVRALPLRPGGAGTAVRPSDAGTVLVVPEDLSEAYDVRTLLARLVDRGDLLELRGSWATSVVTGLARIEGVPVGVVATQPLSLAGALTPQASQKITEHLALCRRLGPGVLTVVDTPGFLPGPEAEATGTVRHGAALVAAYAAFSSEGGRLITLVTRRAYGGAQVALGSKALSGALTLAWPGARLGVMDADSAVNLTSRRALARAAQEGQDAGALRRRLVAEQEGRESAGVAHEAGWVDEIVRPGATRARIAAALTAGDAPAVRLAPSGSQRHPGDGWVDCACGRRHWGLNGAAGLLVWRRSLPQAPGSMGDNGPADGIGERQSADRAGDGGPRLEVLLQLRAWWTHRGGTWGLPGGAVADGEEPAEAALREVEEETGLLARLLVLGGAQIQEHGTWRYTTLTAQAPSEAAWDLVLPVDRESSGLAWVVLTASTGEDGIRRWAPPHPPTREGVRSPLLPALSAVWEELAALLPQP